MKYNKIFRTLAGAIILALLLVAIPATPALAARVLELDPEEGTIGDRVTITGSGFVPSTETTEQHVDIYFAKDQAGTYDDIGTDVDTYEFLYEGKLVGFDGDPDEGEFEYTFEVPARLNDGTDDEDLAPGTYYVYVTYYTFSRIRAVAEFTVIAGGIELDPVKGPVDTEVEITGTTFGDRENITVEYDGKEVDIESGDVKTDSVGEFKCTIIIPESTADDHTITVSDGAGSVAEAIFTVQPQTSIAPTSGVPGTMVTVSGTGFGYRSNFSVFFGTEEVVKDERADSDGSFKVTFNVPVLATGVYDVEVEDEDNNSDKVEFTIAASASLSPTTGNIGTELTVSGTGFVAGGTVTIKYDTTQVTTTIADVIGAFSATFNVPKGKYGEHAVTASDGINTRQFTFTMESTPPPIPAPLKPEMGVKAEAQAYFVWEDVKDDSPPVTYTLQIASDKEFTSIVLEKTELTQSEYTIAEQEKLESVSKDAPYYWRVKAIDGASNESEWTGAGTFYMGFSMPQWVIYTLFGIGALLLGLLGFWLGRRTAYYSY